MKLKIIASAEQGGSGGGCGGGGGGGGGGCPSSGGNFAICFRIIWEPLITGITLCVIYNKLRVASNCNQQFLSQKHCFIGGGCSGGGGGYGFFEFLFYWKYEWKFVKNKW